MRLKSSSLRARKLIDQRMSTSIKVMLDETVAIEIGLVIVTWRNIGGEYKVLDQAPMLVYSCISCVYPPNPIMR
jgi:hypothetical protein